MITAEQGYRHCRAVVQKKAGNFAYAFLFLPRAERRALHAVYAFCHSCDAVADGILSEEQKRALLTEYRENLRRVERDEYVDDAVFAALADAVKRFRLPMRHFDDLLDGVMMDLDASSYETFDDLRLYCRRVAGAVGRMVVGVLGGRGAEVEREVEALGLAMQLTNILRDLREDAARRRVYLPQEDFREFGYTEEDLFRFEQNHAYLRLMAFEVARARGFFEEAKPLFRRIPIRGRYCPRMIASLYQQILRKIEKSGYDVFERRIRLNFFEKGTLALGVFLRNVLRP